MVNMEKCAKLVKAKVEKWKTVQKFNIQRIFHRLTDLSTGRHTDRQIDQDATNNINKQTHKKYICKQLNTQTMFWLDISKIL